jgi:hypothetical protein
MIGIGPQAIARTHGDLEPVYLLTKRRISSRPPSRPPSPWAMSESDLLAISDDWTVTRARSSRSRNIRFVGLVAIIATLTGASVLLRHPQAMRQTLSFVSLGHADDVVRLAHRLGALADRVKTP